MNKKELIDIAAEKTTELRKKDLTQALNLITEVISEELADGGEILLVGFGTFSVREAKEREGRNPKTGDVLIIPARKVVKFKAGKALAEAVLN